MSADERETLMMNHDRLELLREALPYIQKFKGKVFVIKLGGKSPTIRRRYMHWPKRSSSAIKWASASSSSTAEVIR